MSSFASDYYVYDTASATLKIDNFSSSKYEKIVFSPDTNNEIQFAICLFANDDSWFPHHVYTQLYTTKMDGSKLPIQYRLSILDENQVKRYSQVYQCTFRKMTDDKVVKLILRKELFELSEELLPDDTLTVLCEVKLYKKKSIEADHYSGDCNIMKNYESLTSGKNFDVVLIAGGKEFQVHKIILSTQSPVFSAMFEHDCKENTENKVTIPDLDAEVCQELLQYMYSGKVMTLDRFALELLAVANKYQLSSLKSICEQHLGSTLATDSVCQVLLHADLHQATALKSKCIEFIIENVDKVKSTEGWQMLIAKGPLLAELFLYLSQKYKLSKIGF